MKYAVVLLFAFVAVASALSAADLSFYWQGGASQTGLTTACLANGAILNYTYNAQYNTPGSIYHNWTSATIGGVTIAASSSTTGTWSVNSLTIAGVNAGYVNASVNGAYQCWFAAVVQGTGTSANLMSLYEFGYKLTATDQFTATCPTAPTLPINIGAATACTTGASGTYPFVAVLVRNVAPTAAPNATTTTTGTTGGSAPTTTTTTNSATSVFASVAVLIFSAIFLLF